MAIQTEATVEGRAQIRISGVLDEETMRGGESFLAAPQTSSIKELRVVCAEVSRINSSGVAAWLIFFGALSARGIKLVFAECSPPIVEQINAIVNFVCGGRVESIQVPFLCDACETEFNELYSTEDLKKIAPNIPNRACPKCGRDKAEFDDVALEYFRYLRR